MAGSGPRPLRRAAIDRETVAASRNLSSLRSNQGFRGPRLRTLTELDLETVQRAQAGDQQACRAIVEALHRPMLATIHRFLGRRYAAEVEDIAQEVFLKVFRSLHRFEPERGVKFSTWAYTFVRNHCFDVLKKRTLKTSTLSADEDHRANEPADSRAARPDAHLTNQELGDEIEAALQTLNEQQRLAFILREFEGLDYQSIADVLGVSEGTVKSRLHRAKEAMRERLAPFLRAGA
jgi:RNA polymerase sigma-70 factor (ECF subfamily)